MSKSSSVRCWLRRALDLSPLGLQDSSPAKGALHHENQDLVEYHASKPAPIPDLCFDVERIVERNVGPNCSALQAFAGACAAASQVDKIGLKSVASL